MAKDCPPHGDEYCANTNMFCRSHRLADIAGFYLAFGLDRTRNNRDREDHLVYCAEFMAFLLTKQSYALDNGHSVEQQQLIADALHRFFADHCGWWWPAFACRLQAKVAREHLHFYTHTAQLLRHFTAWERHAFQLSPFQECPEPDVPAFEPEGTCFACTANPTPTL
jgi:TorA maturation chaperone TorD